MKNNQNNDWSDKNSISGDWSEISVQGQTKKQYNSQKNLHTYIHFCNNEISTFSKNHYPEIYILKF